MRDDLRRWRSGQQKGGEAALGKGELELQESNLCRLAERMNSCGLFFPRR